MGDALKPALSVTDTDRDGIIDAGETVTVTSPESNTPLTFKASAEPTPQAQKALQDVGLDPKYVVGASIAGASRFAENVSAYYRDFVTQPVDYERQQDQYQAYHALETISDFRAFAYAERVDELAILPELMEIEADLKESNQDWDSYDIKQSLSDLVEICTHYLHVPRLSARLQAVANTMLGKMQAGIEALTPADGTPPAIDEVIANVDHAADGLESIARIVSSTGIRTRALSVRITQLNTRLAGLLIAQKDAHFSYLDGEAATESTEHYKYTLRTYLTLLDNLASKGLEGMETLKGEAEAHYTPLSEYVIALSRASSRYDRNSIDDRIAALKLAIDLRKKFDSNWASSPALVRDMIVVLRGESVSDAKKLTAAAKKASLTLTPFQQTFVHEAVHMTAAALEQAVTGYTHPPENYTPDASRTFASLQEDMSSLTSFKLIATRLRLATPYPDIPALVDTKPVYAQAHALLAGEGFLQQVVLSKISDLRDCNVASEPRGAIRQAKYASTQLGELKSSYLTLLRSSAKRGGVYSKDALTAGLEPAVTRADAIVEKGLAYCQAYAKAAAIFGKADAKPEEKQAAIAAIRTTGQELGFSTDDLSFLDRVIVVESPPAPPAP